MSGIFKVNVLVILRMSTKGDEASFDTQKTSCLKYIKDNKKNFGSNVIDIKISQNTESGFTSSPSGLNLLKDSVYTHVVVFHISRLVRDPVYLSQLMAERKCFLIIHESCTGSVYYVSGSEQSWPGELRMKIYQAYCSSKEKSDMAKARAITKDQFMLNLDNHDRNFLKYSKNLLSGYNSLLGKVIISKYQTHMKSYAGKRGMKGAPIKLLRLIKSKQGLGNLLTASVKKMKCPLCNKTRYVSNDFSGTVCSDIALIDCDTEELHRPIIKTPLADQIKTMTIHGNSPGPQAGGRYIVEEILSDRIIKKRKKSIKQYLIKWVGYSPPTWEPADIIKKDITDMVLEYEFNL